MWLPEQLRDPLQAIWDLVFAFFAAGIVDWLRRRSHRAEDRLVEEYKTINASDSAVGSDTATVYVKLTPSGIA
jgi:hypothetical protein